jgi:cell division control protein 7
MGRKALTGDPEQNIKGIAQLRGSEELWEVAKLHNRESSFPEELYESRYFKGLELRKWCELNTNAESF